jgi:hypothetical protein
MRDVESTTDGMSPPPPEYDEEEYEIISESGILVASNGCFVSYIYLTRNLCS